MAQTKVVAKKTNGTKAISAKSVVSRGNGKTVAAKAASGKSGASKTVAKSAVVPKSAESVSDKKKLTAPVVQPRSAVPAKPGLQAKGVAPLTPEKINGKKHPGAEFQVAAQIAKAAGEVLEDHNFKTSDKVVYPAHGVGIIDSIQARKVSGDEQKFYMITIIESGMKIMVPVSQSRTVGLRRVVDHTTVEKVYDILRDRKVQLDTQTWNRRYREYSQKIKTGSVLEIARVIRDLSVLKSDKELSFGERRMLDTAQGLLVKEISIAKASTEDSIKEELQQLCQVAF